MIIPHLRSLRLAPTRHHGQYLFVAGYFLPCKGVVGATTFGTLEAVLSQFDAKVLSAPVSKIIVINDSAYEVEPSVSPCTGFRPHFTETLCCKGKLSGHERFNEVTR